MEDRVIQTLRHRLAGHAAPVLDDALLEGYDPGARPSAVLLLLYPLHGEPHIVLTRRAEQLSQHSGQIALPGGRIDPYDPSPVEAALRETREELGINTDELEVLGALDPVYVNASRFLILPFVASSPRRPVFVPNQAEVDEVIEVPLRHLLSAAAPAEERWIVRGDWRRVGLYRYGHHKIWGATARVLRQLIALLDGPAPPPGRAAPGEVLPLEGDEAGD